MSTDHVVLTRTHADNRPLRELLEAQGLRCTSYPCIATCTVTPDDDALQPIQGAGPLAAVAFPSRRAVAGLLDQPALLARLALRDDVVIGAVGPATARALAARDRAPDLVAEPATGAALGAALVARLELGSPVLIPGGSRPRPELPDTLTDGGLIPLALQVYAHEALAPPPLEPPPPSVVVCASPSAAEAFLGANPTLTHVRFVVIGPTTEQALAHLGATAITRAAGTDLDSLLDAVLQLIGS